MNLFLSKKEWLFLLITLSVSRIFTVGFIELISINFVGGKSVFDLLCQWDCGWYLSIIQNGYDIRPHAHDAEDAANWAFFPLFPMLTRGIVDIFKIGAVESAFFLSTISFFCGCILLFKYLKTLFDEKTTKFIILAIAFSPLNLYFSVPYTEAVYFFLMISVIYFCNERKWLMAGFLGVGLSLTRNLGVMIVFPMLIIAINQVGLRSLIKFNSPLLPSIATGILLAPLGLFMYMFFLYYYTGDAFAFKNIQIAWGRELHNPLDVLMDGIIYGGVYEKYCALVVVISLFLAFYLMFKKYFSEGLIVFLGTIIPLSTALASMPRYTLTLFPIYMSIGRMTQSYLLLRLFLLFLFVILSCFYILSWVTGKGYMI